MKKKTYYLYGKSILEKCPSFCGQFQNETELYEYCNRYTYCPICGRNLKYAQIGFKIGLSNKCSQVIEKQ